MNAEENNIMLRNCWRNNPYRLFSLALRFEGLDADV
jgi:hypothetical protein